MENNNTEKTVKMEGNQMNGVRDESVSERRKRLKKIALDVYKLLKSNKITYNDYLSLQLILEETIKNEIIL